MTTTTRTTSKINQERLQKSTQLTMEEACMKPIEDHFLGLNKWKQESLVFTIGDYKFDVVPYLRGGLKEEETLSFPNSADMDQSALVGFFKQQSVLQGVHLVCMDSSRNPNSRRGRFFQLACARKLLFYDSKNKEQNENLYHPDVKTGSLRANKKTRGLAGKTQKRRTQTTKASCNRAEKNPACSHN
jgi:hypothetical protein